MDHIWAPWRNKFIYIRKHKKCIFCIKHRIKDDKKFYVLERSEFAFSMFNKFPYNNGHLMVAPYRHVKETSKLKDNELLDLLKLVSRSTELLMSSLSPHGFNIGFNIGKIAGAGFPGHLHIHIVPRWSGDTNFMPIIAHTKIVSESLGQLYERLKDAVKKRNRSA